MKRMNWRMLVATAHDIVAAALAWLAAYALAYDFAIPPRQVSIMLIELAWVIPLEGIIFMYFGLYRGIWRFASLPDLRRIALAAGSAALAVPALLWVQGRLGSLPAGIPVLNPVLLVMMMGGSRFLYRAWKDGDLLSPRPPDAQPVLVMGAGEVAVSLLRALAQDNRWKVMGLLSDDASKTGRQIHGATVLGGLEEVAEQARRLNVGHVIVAIPGDSSETRRRAIEQAVNADLHVMTVPALADVLAGKVSVSEVRHVDLADVLGRAPVRLDGQGLHGLLSNRTVLVTGAGGSIGAELARQVARFEPGTLVFHELSEFALYVIEQEFLVHHPALPIASMVGDCKEEVALRHVMARHRPEVVFHAAAYKHVPLMEGENAWAAVRNNVLGTLGAARAAMSQGVGKFVLISTDKAVNPTSVMGASKRLAERVCQALQHQSGHTTRFVTVRFGNVLGSSGSVIPKFREQIARGGPVTVTHPEIVRYFMLIPEAAQLVLQAALMGGGGETFVLDMGEPIRIVDLARDMIRLSGFSEREIPIQFTGLRPGEKLYEELLADWETTLPTHHDKLRISRENGIPDADWLRGVEQWLAAPARTEYEVKAGLRGWVPEYRPAEH
ncbi:polysaccharide biosynthesis protein [Denitratisoma oestradiolicum]|uniref:Capsular polysaccharide biosynthesis protein CapD n=1 Tax=Denitratisoma oestradiolicum TaxID=311182 RepID=A0A6S6YI56_9PROT|nr:nucleoside-diphosphate sugar epimerase/dehydratase [Denitratisoma oestradiolicum]TWO80823.1 polysaccharide biosynthesis protein [Denitratisoma oestradiolicum]CAB1367434.1 Capsular polysaccharide biosynthesis protein CapD [Denitratisoma oestradiolicum]